MSSAPVADSASASADRALISRVFWRLVPFLFLLYVVAYLDRINVGFATLQMKQRLGFGDNVFGLAFGIFFAGYFTFQVPSNILLDRFGARRWIATLMVAWGIVCCMTLPPIISAFSSISASSQSCWCDPCMQPRLHHFS